MLFKVNYNDHTKPIRENGFIRGYETGVLEIEANDQQEAEDRAAHMNYPVIFSATHLGEFQGLITDELIFDKEIAEGLYRIFCGLTNSCYTNAPVSDDVKINMQKAYEKVKDWGNQNVLDITGTGNNRIVKCDGCSVRYNEPNPATQFGEFNVCTACKLRTDLQFE